MRIFAAILFILSLSPAYAVDVGVYWTAESGASGYYVYYSEDSGVTWSAGTDAGVATNYTMTGMDEDKVVLFCVNAHYSNWTNYVECQTGAWYDHREAAAGAYAPTDLSFTWSTNGLAWTEISGNDGYKVYSKNYAGEWPPEWTLLRDAGDTTSLGIARIFGSLMLYRGSGYVEATEHINYRSGVWTNLPSTKPTRFRR